MAFWSSDPQIIDLLKFNSPFIRDNNSYAIQPDIYKDELNDLFTLRSSLTGSVLMAHASLLVDYTFPTKCTCHVFGETELDLLKACDGKVKCTIYPSHG